MTNEFKNVVVLGASGTVGTTLIPFLISAGFRVTTVTRSASDVFSGLPVTSYQASYTDLSALEQIFTNQDAVISTVAPFGVPSQKVAIDAAVAAGVKRFIPSEYGMDTDLAHAAEVAPFVVGKQGIVKYLKGKEGSGLSWTAICSSAFFPWQLELGCDKMGWDVANHRATLFDDGTQPYDASTVAQVARAIVAVLQHPSETANTHIYLKSFTLTQRRVVEALESITGRPVEISHSSAVKVHQNGLELVKQGDLANGYPKITTGVAFGPYGLSEFGNKTEKWMRLLGLQSEEDEFENVVRESLKRMKVIQ